MLADIAVGVRHETAIYTWPAPMDVNRQARQMGDVCTAPSEKTRGQVANPKRGESSLENTLEVIIVIRLMILTRQLSQARKRVVKDRVLRPR
jgi:hypothetical protein